MTSLLRAAAIAVAALALLVTTGCGGDTESKNDYVSAINKVQTDFADSVQKSSAAGGGGTAEERAKETFASLGGAIDKLIADLRAIEPPDEVKQLHQRLISQMGEFNGDIEKASDALGSNDPQKLLAAQSQFATSASSLGTEISQTISDINTELQE